MKISSPLSCLKLTEQQEEDAGAYGKFSYPIPPLCCSLNLGFIREHGLSELNNWNVQIKLFEAQPPLHHHL